MMDPTNWYVELAAAYVRGRLPQLAEQTAVDWVRAGQEAGLRLHRFKRTAELPRVQRVLGILRGLMPASLLDVGTGRGTFLWPLLDAFPELPVTAIDLDALPVRDLQAVHSGGVRRLRAVRANVAQLCFANASFDVVTILEILEHLPSPDQAVAEALRVGRRFIVASVPAREDDNPQHIHRFDVAALTSLFRDRGAARVTCESVRNHLVAVIRI